MSVLGAALIRAHRVWTVETLRISTVVWCRRYLMNWRLKTRRKLPTGSYQKSVHPEGQCALQAARASRPCGIGSIFYVVAMLVLKPGFEADLPPEQYAYRPGRNAQQAVIKVDRHVPEASLKAADAGSRDYRSIPHAELLKVLCAGLLIGACFLHLLIKMWLECPVKTDDRGRKTRTTEASRDNRRGIPQGSPISPLLAEYEDGVGSC